jgi:hypothetical protein
MVPTSVYIARVSCGCVIDIHPVWEDVSDILWLASVRGNGWTVERVDIDTPVQMDCTEAANNRPLRTMNMFGDAS